MVHLSSHFTRPQWANGSRFRHWRTPALIAVLAFLAAQLVAAPAQAAMPPRSLFVGTEVPKTAAVSSSRTANVGVKFTTSASGAITALKFYRGARQTKAYTGSLWSSKGKRLAKVTFSASTKVGWQTKYLSKPLSIKKATTYYVSYLATGGHYPLSSGAFAKKYSHDGITVATSGGRYTYSKSSTRPTHSSKTNYFVDVVFVPTSSPISDTELRTAATKRVFFGHQSVGGNVLSGISALYSSRSIAGPDQVEISDHGAAISPASGGVLANAYVGDNGDPDGKVDDFAAYLRGGVAGQVRIAVVKYCFVDIYDGVDVAARFEHYRSVMTGLEAEFPDVVFLYATNPLETGASSNNVARAQFNALVRTNFAATGRLWDLAAVESTRPDGSTVAGSVNGQHYEALYGGYSADGGHLNSAGAKVAAAELLRLIAQVG